MKRIAFSVMMILSGTLFSCGGGGDSDYRAFYAADFTLEEYYQVQAKKVKTGNYCEVYLDSASQNKVTSSTINGIVSKFDNEIYPMVTSKFGEESDVDANGKIIILILDIKDGWDGKENTGYVGGYFDSYNELSESSDNRYTNMCDMIYVDCYPGDPTSIETAGIVAHEFQHLVNYNINGLSNGGAEHEIWLNEGLSSVAECFAQGGGELTYRSYDYYTDLSNGRTDNFYTWGNSMTDYSSAYLFFQWIRFHSDDDSVFHEITNSAYHDYRAVINGVRDHVSYYSGLSASPSESDWQIVFGDWLIANQLSLESGIYGYEDKITDFPMRDNSEKNSWALYPGQSVIEELSASYTPSTVPEHVVFKAFTVDGVVDDTAPYEGDYLLAFNGNTAVSGDSVVATIPDMLPTKTKISARKSVRKPVAWSGPVPIDAVIGRSGFKGKAVNTKRNEQ